MNGVHDLGGTDGLGPVIVEENEPVWHAEWEKAGTELDGRTAEVLATPRTANHHQAHREPVAVEPALT